MTSNKLSTSNTARLELSENEKVALKIHIRDNMQGLKIESAMSLGLFFNTIEISSLGTLPYSREIISKWNHWIQLQKESCIKRSRTNATKSPSVIYDKLTDFFTTLTFLGLLDQTDTTIQSIRQKIADLLPEDPTL